MALYDALQANGVDFEMHRRGLLFLFLSEASMDHHAEDLALMQAHGYQPPRALTAAEVRDLEQQVTPEVIGGLCLQDERHVRPETLAAGLASRLSQMDVEIHSHVEVTGARRRGRTVHAVVTEEGDVETDRVLLAAGAWSGRLARRFGFSLPVLPGKGYSITVIRPAFRLGRPLQLGGAKVACSPFHGALRVAGTVEITSLTPKVAQRRIAAIRRAARRYLTGWERGEAQAEWMGMRPFLPDGLPAIGRAPGYDNLYVAAGHGYHPGPGDRRCHCGPHLPGARRRGSRSVRSGQVCSRRGDPGPGAAAGRVVALMVVTDGSLLGPVLVRAL
jgi:D-amino-acid dehydrogenase